MTDIKVSPYKTKLDKGNAYWMARLSKEVYETESEDNKKPNEKQILTNLQKDDSHFMSVFSVDKNSAQGAVIEHENFLCLSFAGTNELKDWLDNINVFPINELHGEYHRGFWNSVKDIWEPLNKRMLELQKEKTRPIFITGHSLGGAMATIAAAIFIHEDKPFTSVYTFGQPRALKRKTAQTFNEECRSRFFRFQNNNDVVTRAPTRSMGYSHVGSYLYISQEKQIHPEVGFWFKFLDFFDGAFNALQEDGIDMIEDHKMKHYLEAVQKWNFQDE